MKVLYLCLVPFLIGFSTAVVSRSLGYSIWVSLGLVVLFVVIYRFLFDLISKDRKIPREVKSLRKKFKKYFGLEIDWKWFSKDTSDKSWRDKNSKQEIIIQHKIDNILPPLAKDFLEACNKEGELMSPYYGGQERKINEKKDLKKISEIQKEISLTKEKFQNTVKVAREGGFKASESAKEYVETEKKEEKAVEKREQ